MTDSRGLVLYTTVGSSDIARSVRFYDALFGALGVPRGEGWTDSFVGWGPDYHGGVSFWVCTPFDGRAPSAGNGQMIGLRAESAAQVRAAYAAAMAHGGTDDGAPGTRPYYEPSFFVAYVRDPDGAKLAIVHHRYDAASEG